MLARSRRPRIRVFAAWSLACAALAALALPSVAQALNLPGRIAYVRCTTSLVDCPLVVRQADGSGGITTIDGDVGAETLIGRWPSFAPDGSAVAYLDRKPAVEMDFVPIAVAKTDGSGSTVIRNRGYGSPTWRPVGASVAFVDDPDDELPGQVRTISPTGGSESQLFDLDREPFVQPPGAPFGWLADSLQWLPGGSQLLLSANGPSTPGGPQDRSAFFLIPAGSGEFATLTPNTPGASFTAPRLSRDGARLAYVYADTSTAQQLRVRDLAGTSEVTVPIGALTIVEPHDFSPDGESVLISARDPASPSEVHLYVVAIDGGAPPARVFADGASHEASAAWFSESRPTAITSGPSGLTNQSAAQFSLTQVGAPVAGNFECRLDGAPFAPCSSTVSLPGLADGQHTFEARFVIAGGGTGPTVSRTWTVDATPPSVIIDSAPAGETADPGATIVFASSEPDGASFKCRVDGGEFFDCPSPLRLDGLAAGEHGFEVVTVDRAGNVSQPVSRFWTVVVPPPAPPVTAECAPGDQASVAFGVLVVIATQPSSCLRPTTFQGQAAFAATGPVRVNGIDVRPAGPGDRIIVSQALGQGTVRSDGQAILSLDGKDLGPAQELDFSNLDVAVHNKISTFLDEVKTLYKFPLQAGTTLELSAENGGQAKLTFKIGLPEKVLAAGPTGGGPGGSPAVTVEVPVTASNSRGVTYGAKAQVSELWLGKKILIKEFSVAIDLGEETLTITGGLALNESFGAKSLKGAGADAVLDGTLKLKASDGALFGFLQELTVGVSDLERHIGGGFFLQRAALSLGSQSEGSRLYGKLGGSGRVSFGPKISQTLVFNGYLAAADATISLLFPANEAALNGPDPVRVVAEGSGTLLNLPVSKMTATQFWPDKYTLTGEIDLSVSGWGVKAQITEALFDINALEESELLVVGNASFGAFGGELRADAVVGRHGYGVCFGPAGSQVGLAQFLSLTQPAKVFANSCDIGAIRAQVAQAGVPARGLDVAPGTRVQTAIVQGAGGPPKVELRGPRGESFSTPAGSEPVSSRSHMIVQDTSRNATFVALFGPTSGRWELSARADGPAITRVQSATNLPRVRPRTTVRKLRNGRLQLTWSAPGLAGRSLQLAERAGASTRTLVSTRRARGTKTFTPMPASTRRRAIETRLVRDQIPGKATVTSRFTAADSRPGRASNVQLRSRRILTWSLPGAQRTVAVVTLPDGTTTSQRVSGRRLRLERRLPKGSRLTVTLTGLDALGRSGRPVTARLRAR